MTGSSDQIAVGPIVEPHELSVPPQMHLPDETRAVTGVCQGPGQGRQSGTQNGIVAPRSRFADLPPREKTEAGWRAERHLAVRIGENSPLSRQAVQSRRVNGLAAITVAHKSETVLVTEQKEYVWLRHDRVNATMT